MNEKENSLRTLFFEAVEITDAVERAAYLQSACGDDATLRQRLERLLKAHADAGGIATTEGVTSGGLPVTEKPGDRIGRYKLREQIGEGGCGVVYVAEQEEPVRRRVALKVIKLGMDTKQVVARFEAERQALAMMDHPNIAKVLDAGATDTGRPYFVMELVRGIKITDYCDQNKLSTKQRLDLFIQVCRAVQHAHQKGIIHRDLKPSNILVTSLDGRPAPKVIDFGIAKATEGRLTDLTVYTELHQFIGTPAYMSPEQAGRSGLDIDTRSDIYSLGVLLYELLTGRTPFDAKALLKAGLDEMRRIIREQEPVKPSTRLSTLTHADLTEVAHHRQVEAPKLIHVVRGDLDWIVMKALEKDRTRRYETANGLAVDIQRHLQNEPVVACPPSNFYRFQKLVRRNKLAFGAASAVAAALILGLGLSTWLFLRERAALKVADENALRAEQQARRAERSRQQAEANEKKAESEAAKSQQVAQFMKDMLKGVGPSVALGRDTTMLREIVDKTAERLSTDLKGQPEVELELRLTLFRVYWDLTLYKKMEENARETLRLARAHFGDENLAVADALGQVARALFYLRMHDEAETFSRQAIAMQRTLRGPGSVQEADSVCTLGDVLRHKRKLEEAEAACRECLAMRRRLFSNDTTEVAWALNTLSAVLTVENKLPEAEATAREAVAIHRRIYGDEHPATGANYQNLGWVLCVGSADRLEEAEACFRKALAIQERTEGKGKATHIWGHYGLVQTLEKLGKLEEAEIHYRAAVAFTIREIGLDLPDLRGFVVGLADFLRKRGKLTEAETVLRDAITIMKQLLGNEHRDVDNALGNLARVLRDQGKLAEAEAVQREELAVEKKLSGEEHPFVANSLNILAAVLRGQGKLVEAESVIREALAMRRKFLSTDDPDLAATLAELTTILVAQEKFAEAEPLARECLAIRKKKLPEDWPTFNAHALLGRALLGQKNYTEAEPLLLAGYEGMKQREAKIPTVGRPRLKETLQGLVELYELTNRPDQAAEWKRTLAEFEKASPPKP